MAKRLWGRFLPAIDLALVTLALGRVCVSSSPPSDWFNVGVLAIIACPAILFLLCWRFIIAPAPAREQLRIGFLTRNDVFLLCVIIILALPPSVAALSFLLSIDIFTSGCSSPRMLDYTWLVLDSLAKGALLDFMESFNIHIYSCAPNQNSNAASTIVFLIRLFTFVFAWVLWRLWKSWRRKWLAH